MLARPRALETLYLGMYKLVRGLDWSNLWIPLEHSFQIALYYARSIANRAADTF